jgi:ADP-ribosylglycohydrolase
MIELALHLIRKIGGPAVMAAWTVSAVIAFCLPTTPRTAEAGNFSDDISLAATVAWAMARLGRAHITDVKWALTDAEDRADARLLKFSGAMSRSD